jgi:hypothetical protein
MNFIKLVKSKFLKESEPPIIVDQSSVQVQERTTSINPECLSETKKAEITEDIDDPEKDSDDEEEIEVEESDDNNYVPSDEESIEESNDDEESQEGGSDEDTTDEKSISVARKRKSNLIRQKRWQQNVAEDPVRNKKHKKYLGDHYKKNDTMIWFSV